MMPPASNVGRKGPKAVIRRMAFFSVSDALTRIQRRIADDAALLRPTVGRGHYG